ncbi:hypothetical protein LTS12_028642, partial [Elasticomyces elasticus]
MPMKLPKTFRRRSSGNVLEDIPNPPQSSFRVLERTSGDAKSASEGNLLSPKNAEAQRRSSQPLQEPPHSYFVESPRPPAYNRYSLSSGPLASIRKRLTRHSDSGGTVNSNVTTGTYESSPSLRFSSSSASRPSNEMTTPDQAQPPRFYDKPPSMTGALRAAGRTLSLGGRFSKQSQPSMPQPLATNRMTIAGPPQFLDSELDLGKGTGFESMLDNFGNSIHHQEQESPREEEAAPAEP